jgi:hypothetical protein
MSDAEVEQLRLDLADAQARLDGIQKAIARRDELRSQLVTLTRQRRELQRKLKESEWSLASMLATVRRRAQDPPPTGKPAAEKTAERKPKK